MRYCLRGVFTCISSEKLREGAPTGFAMTGAYRCVLFLFIINLKFMHSQAHVNLNDEYLPYKHIIGQLILDVSGFCLAQQCILTYQNSEKQESHDSR